MPRNKFSSERNRQQTSERRFGETKKTNTKINSFFLRLKMQNFTLLLLVLLVDFLLAASVNPLASRAPITKTRIRYIHVDDDDDEDIPEHVTKDPEQARETPAPFIPRKCDYDPCVVAKVPCSVIAAQTKCYCPGITGPDKPPAAPEIKEVKEGASGQVEIHWCAPQSTVTFYKVITGEGQEPHIFNNSSRTGLLQGVNVGARICVLAANDVGLSTESETSCIFFESQKSSQVHQISWVIAGVIGLLILALVFVVALLLRRRRGRKNGGGGGDGEGLRNPSYTTNETL